MAIDTGFQQQQPLGWSAAVRSAPSPRHGARAPSPARGEPEENSVWVRVKR